MPSQPRSLLQLCADPGALTVNPSTCCQRRCQACAAGGRLVGLWCPPPPRARGPDAGALNWTKALDCTRSSEAPWLGGGGLPSGLIDQGSPRVRGFLTLVLRAAWEGPDLALPALLAQPGGPV